MWTAFRAVRRRVAQQRAALEAETVVLDSGWVGATIRLRSYRDARRRVGVGIQGTRCQLVLTRQRLVVIGPRFPPVPLAELKRYSVASDGQRLHLVTDQPMEAEGHFDLRVRVPDPDAWVPKLVEAGAQQGTVPG